MLRMQALYEGNLPEPAATVSIYQDRIEFRNGTYSSLSGLSIALQAAVDPPDKVVLHDCNRLDTFEEVVDLLRRRGDVSFEIELPEQC